MRHRGGRSANPFFIARKLIVGIFAMVACATGATVATAAPGVPVTVTATKDVTSTQITKASFTILQSHKVVWDATYSGTPTQGHRFYLSQNVPPIPPAADILLTNGGFHGTHFLTAGTYHIAINLALMGPGTYSVRFDPTGDGSTVGDPHITTVNGVHYDFQSAGEFVALRDGLGMEIQTRQSPVSSAGTLVDPYSGLSTGVSINTAVAARMGAHRVSLQLDPGPQSTDSRLRIRVDGQVRPLTADGIDLGANGRISRAAEGAIRLDFANGTELVVTPGWWQPQRRWYLNLDVQNSPAHHGIMGLIEGRNWLPALPDGSRSGARPASLRQRYRKLYGRFADAWRVTAQSSLFDYGPGESTHGFTLRDWPRMRGPFVVRGSQAVPMTPRPVAQAACRRIENAKTRRDCVFDVRLMGDPGVAKTYERLQRAGRAKKASAQ